MTNTSAVTIVVLAAFAGSLGEGTAEAQVESRILKRKAPPISLPCSNPAVRRGSIRLESARLTEGGNKILLTGCFGLNQSKQLGVWVRRNTGSAAAPRWAVLKGRQTSWQGAKATVAFSQSLVGSARAIEVTIIQNPQSPLQLTGWVRVSTPTPPSVPPTGPIDADGDGAYSVATGGDDCDDRNPHRYAGNTEIADADDVDEDCDPATFGHVDVDLDGYPDSRFCNQDGSGGLICGTDCDDSNASIHPTQIDVLNGRDDDCDGDADEDQTIEMVRELLQLESNSR